MLNSTNPILFEPISTATAAPTSFGGHLPGLSVTFHPSSVSIALTGQQQTTVDISFSGARSTAPEGDQLLPSYTNYLLGGDPAQWRTHVPNYARVRYPDLYAGIDAVFYGNSQHLEHDFLVAPGADPGQIHLHLSPDAHASLAPHGGVTLTLSTGTLELQRPVLYQTIAGVRQPRDGAFRLLANGDIAFRVGSYDHRVPLTIDPVLNFATYLSPLAIDAPLIATDAVGNSYVTGVATPGFPVTPNSVPGCTTCSTNNVATYISKLSPDGSQLLYSTLLGGNNFAQPAGIAVDTSGDVVVSGTTSATDFPVKNSQPIARQDNTNVGFLVSLSPDGSSFNFSTVLGTDPSSQRSFGTGAGAVALDTSGNVYVTGGTGLNFHVTPGALNQGNTTEFTEEFNVFLAKFSPVGHLMYSAILGAADPQNGGDGPIGSEALAVDADGNAFVAGQAGALWPITSNAYLKQIEGTQPFATPFVTKVSADGSTLLYSTFLNYAYQVANIALLGNGNVWVAGDGAEANYPTTPGAYQTSSPTYGSFLVQLDSTGSNLAYSTLLGTIPVSSMSLDANGTVWLAGHAQNGDTTLVAPLQSAFPPSRGVGFPSAATLAQFDSTGKSLLFSTFLGGPVQSAASSVAVDPAHRAHVAGWANYGAYTTAGAYAGSVPMPGSGYEMTAYSYFDLVDPAVQAPALCVSPNAGINIFQAAIGIPFSQTLSITSCGALPLTISSITSASPLFTVPASLNMCPQTLPPGQKCSLIVQYTPTTQQADTSTLTITSNAPIPTTVLSLNGMGVPAPLISLSTTSLTFPAQEVGTTSATSTITLTNTGAADLTNYFVQIDGANYAAFAQTSTCGATVLVGQSCTISIAFSPTTAGAASASLDVDGFFQQASVALSGTGVQTGFSIAPQSTGSNSATVTAGNPATYALSLAAANGFSGTIRLSCTGLPVNASCTVNPASIMAASGSTTPFTVTVQTKASTAASNSRPFGVGAVLTAALVFLGVPGKLRRRALAGLSLLGLLLATLPALTGCGGSGSGKSPTPTAPTVAPGNYTVEVTATAGNTSTNQALTLVVH